MSYLVLARKYRPQSFEAVVGQQHVTQTLNNAIGSGRVAHAMLFSGPRGTGKTTIARILAKAMNCESGMTPTPCNTCRSCRDITAGRGVDVFEIDGASNNSVDQVRELRDNSRYMPAHSRFKIYIIDEVHMLSIAAFNALLKTLEEPPAHVLFFFATTEAHKIPVTILSRCQRHDLRRIDPEAIAAHLEALCHQESVSVASGNLRSIARESGGSMRDALSLLDQILACSESQTDDGFVSRLIGGMDRQVLMDISEAVFARDINRVLAAIDAAFKRGQDMKRFYADLLLHFRHLMLIKMDARPDMLTELSADEIHVLTRQVEGVSIAFIDQVLTSLFSAETSVRQTYQPRLAIEAAFFKIQQITPALPIDALIQRLDSLLRESPPSPAPRIVEAQSTYGMPLAVPPAVQDRHVPPRPETDGLQTDAAGQSGDAWARVVAAIAEKKPSIAAALSQAHLVSVSDQTFKVAVHGSDYTMNLVKKNSTMIESISREQTGMGVEIDFSGDDRQQRQAASAKQQAKEIRHQLLNHPLVADAVEIFNGKIEEVKIK